MQCYTELIGVVFNHYIIYTYNSYVSINVRFANLVAVHSQHVQSQFQCKVAR